MKLFFLFIGAPNFFNLFFSVFFFFFSGADVPVTNRNREEYVRLYVEYTMDVSIGPQFDAFQKGKGCLTF